MTAVDGSVLACSMTTGARGADFLAQRRVDVELAAGLEAEVDVVLHRAGGPGAVGDAGDGGEAHAGVVGRSTRSIVGTASMRPMAATSLAISAALSLMC